MWKWILHVGSHIESNGLLDIQVVPHLPAAQNRNLDESYFHLSARRKSRPERAITAYTLFKEHVLQENPESSGITAQIAKLYLNNPKDKKIEEKIKSAFSSLSAPDRLEWQELALCD